MNFSNIGSLQTMDHASNGNLTKHSNMRHPYIPFWETILSKREFYTQKPFAQTNVGFLQKKHVSLVPLPIAISLSIVASPGDTTPVSGLSQPLSVHMRVHLSLPSKDDWIGGVCLLAQLHSCGGMLGKKKLNIIFLITFFF